MIRVNLAGDGLNKHAPPRARLKLPANSLLVLWAVVVLCGVAYGYFWRSGLIEEQMELANQIASAQRQLAELQSVIAENEIFEARGQMLENRIRTIEALQRNQVSPVVLLDRLGDALTPTRYVWLTQFAQSDSTITMAGVGTSVNAIADFVTSLEDTGYFRDINLVNAQDTDGTFSFQMICEFVPPPLPAAGTEVSGPSGGAD
jgi:Tfp pilus assembly protein PilN